MCSPRFRDPRPLSGSSRPAIRLSSVVLPSPLRPTMPIRSPTPTPRLTSSSRIRIPKDFETFSKLIRLDMHLHSSYVVHDVRPGDRTGRDQDSGQPGFQQLLANPVRFVL